jgi:transposase
VIPREKNSIMTNKIEPHHTPEELLQLSKNAKTPKIAHRFLAIRDLLIGDERITVRKRYGISSDTLWQWTCRYNEKGVEGLIPVPQKGRPFLLPEDNHELFLERIKQQPSYEKDGVVRWRAKDIQKVLEQDFNASYQSVSGVRRLCHALKLSYLTTRPSHPKKDAQATEDFKKNCQKP